MIKKTSLLFESFFKKPRLILLITILLSIIPGILLFHKIITGDIPLWYDPARDLLSGLANLQKPTLIGPTSGIPGVFYGPYWIWLLSIGQIFSYDPRIVTLVTAMLPYLLLFPFVLSRFSKVLSVFTLALLWLIFLMGFNKYFTDLWNPNPAPLLVLLAIYLQFIKNNEISTKNLITTFCAGFVSGLVMNFHLSFGIGMLFGLIIFLVGESVLYLIKSKKKLEVLMKRAIIFVLFSLGCVVSFAPFLFFELRHQFLQIKTLLNALTHYGGVVGQTGLTKPLIIQLFLDRLGSLFFLPSIVTLLLFIAGAIVYSYQYKKRKDIAKYQEVKLLAIIGSITFGILYLYLTAKNPIWSYHFIGVEILLLLFIGILIDKIKIPKIVMGVIVLGLFLNFIVSLAQSRMHDADRLYGNLAAEEEIVKKIHNESGGSDYVVFAYSPSIYTYEYSYVFKWLYNKDVPYRPEFNPQDSKTVFLIIPPDMPWAKIDDFINFRTPPASYKTLQQFKQKDRSIILKRERYEKN